MANSINSYIHGQAAYRVIAACVVVDLVGGGQKYVYKDGYLPAHTRPMQIQQMLEQGSIEKVEVPS